MTDPRSFGWWLARERESRGIALQVVAARTKIAAARLSALERGDISQWPGGIYRRAFVKAYADVVGLDADFVLANFDRAFPDPDTPAPQPAPRAEELRLLLAPPPAIAGAPASAWRRAGVDVAFAFAAGLIGFIVAGIVGFWSATAVAALVCHVSGALGLTARALALARSRVVRRAWCSVLRFGAPKHQALSIKHQAPS